MGQNFGDPADVRRDDGKAGGHAFDRSKREGVVPDGRAAEDVGGANELTERFSAVIPEEFAVIGRGAAEVPNVGGSPAIPEPRAPNDAADGLHTLALQHPHGGNKDVGTLVGNETAGVDDGRNRALGPAHRVEPALISAVVNDVSAMKMTRQGGFHFAAEEVAAEDDRDVAQSAPLAGVDRMEHRVVHVQKDMETVPASDGGKDSCTGRPVMYVDDVAGAKAREQGREKRKIDRALHPPGCAIDEGMHRADAVPARELKNATGGEGPRTIGGGTNDDLRSSAEDVGRPAGDGASIVFGEGFTFIEQVIDQRHEGKTLPGYVIKLPVHAGDLVSLRIIQDRLLGPRRTACSPRVIRGRGTTNST